MDYGNSMDWSYAEDQNTSEIWTLGHGLDTDPFEPWFLGDHEAETER
jgi:hypothetical protein